MVPPPVITVRNIRKTYGRTIAIDDVSFDVQPGEILVMTGLVGSGRSEVARAIFGIDRPDAGAILLDGEPVRIRRPRDAIRRGIALLPESHPPERRVPLPGRCS